MFVQIKRIILFLLILRLAGQVVFSQDHKTRNNYTGAWETPSSWNPTWAVPQNNVNRLDITIYGYITAHNSLTFSGHSSKLIVEDTLVIIGNLTIADNNDVQVNNNGILIVQGNLTFSEYSKIEAKNYIIVTGNIIKLGSTNNGEFSSDDNPARIFVGGTISPSNLTDDKRDFNALNCASPTTTRYPHSGCSYGDMTDIITDRIWSFFQSTFATATLRSSDPDNSFCAGTSVTFTAGGGSNYNFRVNGTSVQNGGSTTYTTTMLTNGARVDVIVTGTGGSIVTSPGITNTVLALPVAVATSNSNVLTGSPLTLTGGPAGMTTYSWTGPNGFTANTQNPTVSPAATIAMAGIYSLTVTNASGCTSSAVTTTVVVNSLPVATATSNSPVCTGSPLSLTGGPAGMTTYSWTGPNGFTANTQSPIVSPAVTVAMAGIYTLTVTNASGSSNAAVTTNVVVNSLSVPTATSNSPICTGSPLSLTGGPTGMTTYSWTGPNGFTANTQSPTVSPAASVAMAGIYTLTVTNNGGCTSAKVTTTVVVNVLPEATANSNSPVYSGSLLTLTGGPAGMTTYSWAGPNGFTANAQSPTVSAAANVAMAGTYTLTIVNASGCIATITQSVIVNENPIAIDEQDQELESKINVPGLFVPSVITPDGDGKNDYFKISENIGRVYLIIFNRWGYEEYSNDGYKNDWDGRNIKGAELPADTYFYVLKFENGKIRKGSVLIIR